MSVAIAIAHGHSTETLQRIGVIGIAVLMFIIVVDQVRRKRLMERYALLWLGASLTLLVMAIWKGLLTTVSADFGIHYPPSTLFAIGFGFLVVMVLGFSLAVSRLTEQSKRLAQHVALLRQRIDALEREIERGDTRGRPSQLSS
jgi:hypothetical protein